MPKRREQASSRGLLSFKPILLAWLQHSAGCQETQSPVGRCAASDRAPSVPRCSGSTADQRGGGWREGDEMQGVTCLSGTAFSSVSCCWFSGGG